MSPTIDHTIISSFKEYIDYKILSSLNAYKNESLRLYRDTTDDRLSTNYSIYASGRPQWVYDSSISGAVIPTSVTHSTGTHNRGDDSMRIDFKNGRIILDPGTSLTNVNISCSTKYFNSYIATSHDEELFVNTTFDRSPEHVGISTSVKGDSYFGPCYFLKTENTLNEGFAFGGTDKTIFNVQAIILTRSAFEQMALCGVMRDLTTTCFKVLDKTPINEFGDLKTVGWDYTTATIGAFTCHIEDATVINIENSALAKEYSSIFPSICKFKIFVIRNPRS